MFGSDLGCGGRTVLLCGCPVSEFDSAAQIALDLASFAWCQAQGYQVLLLFNSCLVLQEASGLLTYIV
jgi:hypothetical protein